MGKSIKQILSPTFGPLSTRVAAIVRPTQAAINSAHLPDRKPVRRLPDNTPLAPRDAFGRLVR